MRVYHAAAAATPARRALLSRLRDTGLVEALIQVESCTSTNDLAREAVEAGIAGSVLALAQTQTAGRGRRDARWADAPGMCLLTSLAWRPQAMGPTELPFVSLAAAVAAARAARWAGVDARVKWPNDVWVNGRKLAGVLVESATRRMETRIVTIGLGMNVHATPHLSGGAACERPPAEATSIAEAGGDAGVGTEALAVRFCASLAGLLDARRNPVRTRIVAAVRDLSALQGREGLVSLESDEWAVRSFEIADAGSLVAHLRDGSRRVVRDSAAHVRPL